MPLDAVKPVRRLQYAEIEPKAPRLSFDRLQEN